MAFTFTTLKSAIQDYLETDETTFVNNLNNIILQAEERILKTVQLPDQRKNVHGKYNKSKPSPTKGRKAIMVNGKRKYLKLEDYLIYLRT